MAQNTFFGYWNPNNFLSLDDLVKDLDIDFGSWYTSESGTIGETFYKEGEWLIYICENRGLPSQNIFWGKSEGFTLHGIGTNGVVNLPSPGTYTKVKLDNVGRIIDAQYLEMSDLPKEINEAVDAVSFDSIKTIVQQVLSTLFTNTDVSPVKLNYDKKTDTVSASIALDETSISINEYGELYSLGGCGEGTSEPCLPDNSSIEFILKDIEDLKSRVSKLETDVLELTPIAGHGIDISNDSGGKVISVKLDESSIRLNERYEISVNPDILQDFVNGGGDCANHEHTVDQIVGLDEYLNNYLTNVKVYDAIKSSLSEMVDGTTVIINNEGKLSAVAAGIQKHTHSIHDLVDFNFDIGNTWASEQLLHSKTAEDEFNAGLIDMSSLPIADILVSFNNTLKDYDQRIEDAKNSASTIKPSEPNDISKAKFTIEEIDEMELFDVKIQQNVFASKEIKIETESLINNSDPHVLVAIVDGEEKESVKCYSEDLASRKFSEGTYGHFTFTYVGDAYIQVPMFQGYYTAYSFYYSVNDLEEGIHTIRFETRSILTNKVATTKEVSCNIYKVADIADWSYTIKSPESTDKVSGVSITNSGEATINIQFSCCTARYTKDKLLGIFNNTTHEFDRVLKADSIDENGLAKYSYSLTPASSQNGKLISVVQPVNILGESPVDEITIKSDYILSDITDVEKKYRVHDSKTKTSLFYTFSNMTGEEDLSTDDFISECQIINNNAEIAKEDFTLKGLGPNYSNKPSTQVISLRFDSVPLRNFYFDLANKDGNCFEKNKDGSLKNIKAFAFLSKNESASGRIDCNSPYDGYSTNSFSETKDFSGLDLFRSDSIRRYVTLGKRPLISESDFMNLYLTIEFSDSIDLVRLIKSVEESINERR